MNAGLTRRIHFLARLYYIPHHDGLHFVRANACSGHRAADRDCAERRRGHILEIPTERADRCPDRLGKNDGTFVHGSNLLFVNEF